MPLFHSSPRRAAAPLRRLASLLLSVSGLLSPASAQAAPTLQAGLPSGPLPMQIQDAESVGTSTNLRLASQTLLTHFDTLARHKNDRITPDDLRSLSQSADPEVHKAARFFAVSTVDRQLAGGAAGLTRDGLARCAQSTDSTAPFQNLLRGHSPASISTDGKTANLYSLLLRDPGVPADFRAGLVRQISDEQLLHLVGHPNTQGTPRDISDETAAFLFLARLSWLGTVEAQAITSFKVPYTMLRGSEDHNASFWDGHQVRLSEKMLSGGTGQVNDATLSKHIGIFAHESGHAIFGLSGLSKAMNDDIARHHLTPGVGAIINEAVAGILQNRAHVAAGGYGADKETDANLVLAHDVAKNIVNDQTFYAHYYHVNTAVARSQFNDVKMILAEVIVPYFQSRFYLLGDPQLALTLPAPQG